MSPLPDFRPGDRVRCTSVAHPKHSIAGTVISISRRHFDELESLLVRVTTDDGFGTSFVVGGALDTSQIETIVLDDTVGPVPDHVLAASGWDHATIEAMRLDPSHPGCPSAE